MSEKTPLRGWGEDSLSKKLDICTGNAYHVFTAQPAIYNLFLKREEVFSNISENLHGLGEDKQIQAGLFFQMTFGAFMGSLRLALGGQIAPAHMVARGILENALYGFYIYQDKERFKIWIDRHEGDEQKKLFIKTFKPALMINELAKVAEKFGGEVKELYDEAIDYGAHPNPNALLIDLTHIEGNDDFAYHWVTNLNENPMSFIRCCNIILKISAYSLKIFRSIFPERFKLLGLSNAVDEFIMNEIRLPKRQ